MVGAVVMLVAGAAFAQQDDTKTQFIDFNEHDIEGNADHPEAILRNRRLET